MLLFMAVCRHWDEALTSCRITHVRLVLLIEDFDDPVTLHPSEYGKTVSAQLQLYILSTVALVSN